LGANSAQLGVLLGAGPVAWAAVTYLRIKTGENAQRRFQNYHGLIKDLVQGDGDRPKIDRQLAVVYDLGNYPNYAPSSRRILSGVRKSAEGMSNVDAAQRLLAQIDETLERLPSR
jgi:hypothetical protein